MRSQDTIFAASSGAGKAAISVIRVSGPGAERALRAFVGDLPVPRKASFRTLRRPGTHDALDQAMVLWLPGPGTATGEDMAELHVHGSRAVMSAVLTALAHLDGFRGAEPGEFVRRGFENGKLDLTAVEGIALLIDAETEAQRRHAVRHATGEAGRRYETWRARLIEAQGLVEAAIDFSDEQDVADDAVSRARRIAGVLAEEIRRFMADARRGEILRDGFRIALMGRPNAGKSSLLNALARRDVAIVSEEAGTTRDVIEVHLDLDGYPVVVSDTAGLRDPTGKVEQEGIRRALASATGADLVLWLWDVTEPGPDVPAELTGSAAGRLVSIANKTDLASLDQNWPGQYRAGHVVGPVISTRTGQGLGDLIALLKAHVSKRLDGGEPIVAATLRQRHQLEQTVAGLGAFMAADDRALELAAEDLRAAANALGRLTGRIDVEDLLDEIFHRFCIGK